jgi:hypothetical protein
MVVHAWVWIKVSGMRPRAAVTLVVRREVSVVSGVVGKIEIHGKGSMMSAGLKSVC